MGTLTVATWRVCWLLTPEDMALTTRKSGCVSKDDDHHLIVMENKSWERREDTPFRFSYIL